MFKALALDPRSARPSTSDGKPISATIQRAGHASQYASSAPLPLGITFGDGSRIVMQDNKTMIPMELAPEPATTDSQGRPLHFRKNRHEFSAGLDQQISMPSVRSQSEVSLLRQSSTPRPAFVRRHAANFVESSSVNSHYSAVQIPATGFTAPGFIPSPPAQPVIFPQAMPSDTDSEYGLFMLGAAACDFLGPEHRACGGPPTQSEVAASDDSQIIAYELQGRRIQIAAFLEKQRQKDEEEAFEADYTRREANLANIADVMTEENKNVICNELDALKLSLQVLKWQRKQMTRVQQREYAKANREAFHTLNIIGIDEMRSRERLYALCMDPKTTSSMTTLLQQVGALLVKVSEAIDIWFQTTQDKSRARLFYRIQSRLRQQYKNSEMRQPKDVFSISLDEVKQAQSLLVSMVKDIKDVFLSMRPKLTPKRPANTVHAHPPAPTVEDDSDCDNNCNDNESPHNVITASFGHQQNKSGSNRELLRRFQKIEEKYAPLKTAAMKNQSTMHGPEDEYRFEKESPFFVTSPKPSSRSSHLANESLRRYSLSEEPKATIGSTSANNQSQRIHQQPPQESGKSCLQLPVLDYDNNPSLQSAEDELLPYQELARLSLQEERRRYRPFGPTIPVMHVLKAQGKQPMFVFKGNTSSPDPTSSEREETLTALQAFLYRDVKLPGTLVGRRPASAKKENVRATPPSVIRAQDTSFSSTAMRNPQLLDHGLWAQPPAPVPHVKKRTRRPSSPIRMSNPTVQTQNRRYIYSNPISDLDLPFAEQSANAMQLEVELPGTLIGREAQPVGTIPYPASPAEALRGYQPFETEEVFDEHEELRSTKTTALKANLDQQQQIIRQAEARTDYVEAELVKLKTPVKGLWTSSDDESETHLGEEHLAALRECAAYVLSQRSTSRTSTPQIVTSGQEQPRSARKVRQQSLRGCGRNKLLSACVAYEDDGYQAGSDGDDDFSTSEDMGNEPSAAAKCRSEQTVDPERKERGRPVTRNPSPEASHHARHIRFGDLPVRERSYSFDGSNVSCDASVVEKGAFKDHQSAQKNPEGYVSAESTNGGEDQSSQDEEHYAPGSFSSTFMFDYERNLWTRRDQLGTPSLDEELEDVDLSVAASENSQSRQGSEEEYEFVEHGELDE